MKLIHTSDLHLGKRVNGFSMLEDQKHVLEEILKYVDAEKPDAVLLSGDVYDKGVPPAEAVRLLDEFLTRLRERKTETFLISGNHDSSERMAFGGRIMDECGIHVSPVYDGQVKPISLEDSWGRVNFYLLPFLRPGTVRQWYPEEEIASYDDAVRVAIGKMNVEEGERNVLLTHQFVTNAQRSESEEIFVGGSDNVNADAFSVFDYVALGHLHRPQYCQREQIRYSGSPLKYSFSECGDEKSVTLVELGEKGDVQVRTLPLSPLRDMREITGTYEELTRRSFYEDTTYRTDYLRIVLTDEEDVFDALNKLRAIYGNVMKLEYRRERGVHSRLPEPEGEERRMTPLECFEEFYGKMREKKELGEEQRTYLKRLIREIWEENQ